MRHDLPTSHAAWDDDDNRFERRRPAKTNRPLPVGLICLGAALGLLGLLLAGAGITAAIWISSDSPPKESTGADEANDAPNDLAPIEPAAHAAAPGLGALPLDELKAATVYI